MPSCPVCHSELALALVLPDDDDEPHATREQWDEAQQAAMLREANKHGGTEDG